MLLPNNEDNVILDESILENYSTINRDRKNYFIYFSRPKIYKFSLENSTKSSEVRMMGVANEEN